MSIFTQEIKQNYTGNKECQSDSPPSLCAQVYILIFQPVFSLKQIANLQFTRNLCRRGSRTTQNQGWKSPENLKVRFCKKDDCEKKGDFHRLRHNKRGEGMRLWPEIGFPTRIPMIQHTNHQHTRKVPKEIVAFFSSLQAVEKMRKDQKNCDNFQTQIMPPKP